MITYRQAIRAAHAAISGLQVSAKLPTPQDYADAFKAALLKYESKPWEKFEIEREMDAIRGFVRFRNNIWRKGNIRQVIFSEEDNNISIYGDNILLRCYSGVSREELEGFLKQFTNTK